MVSNVSLGSMFNLERSSFNPEKNIECLKNREVESPKDFPTLPNESIGKSQVITTGTNAKLPKGLELPDNDKDFLSKLGSDMYGFHGDSNDFWVHSRKQTQGSIPNIIMGDGSIDNNSSRHDFVKGLIDNQTPAFQIAGNDVFGGNKLVTVVKNSESNTVTMYTCDSKECYPMVLDNNVDTEKLASGIIDSLSEIVGATVWNK